MDFQSDFPSWYPSYVSKKNKSFEASQMKSCDLMFFSGSKFVRKSLCIFRTVANNDNYKHYLFLSEEPAISQKQRCPMDTLGFEGSSQLGLFRFVAAYCNVWGIKKGEQLVWTEIFIKKLWLASHTIIRSGSEIFQFWFSSGDYV